MSFGGLEREIESSSAGQFVILERALQKKPKQTPVATRDFASAHQLVSKEIRTHSFAVG